MDSNNQKRRWEELLEGFLADTLSAAEVEEFMSLLDEHDEDYKNAIYDLLSAKGIQAVGTEEQRIRILNKVLEQESDATIPAAHRVPSLKRAWVRYAAAATIVFGTGAYLWNIQQNEKPSVTTASAEVQSTEADLAPGGNRASLTLSNGSTILLDSAANGTIALQGSAQVVKLAPGQISYKIKGSDNGEILYNTMSTPRGGQYQLRLPDGSQVWLNAASSIRYPVQFTGNERKVEITGEVYFEVKHDASKPFIVKTSNASIRVLGTQFNVNAYSDEPDMRTTLLEGSVRIEKEEDQKVLVPGQQAILKGNVIRVTRNVNTDEVVAWRNGQFQFGRETDIRAIMRQIGRWYDVEIEYRGDVNGKIGGSIPRDVPASKVFRLFEATGEVHFKIEGKKVIVLP